MMGFWGKLPRPFFVQAPMEDVTDAAFRRLIARFGKPDVMFMEFTSADGLVLADERGQETLRKKLLYSEGERPVVAQLFSAVPERMEKAAAICAELGCDGIDINMGCPDKAIEKSGCGAALIKNPENARALIRAAKRGAGGLPVSVKTRMGYNTDELDTWVPQLLAEEPANLTMHLRTRKEMSLVPAHWEAMPRVVEMRDRLSPRTLVTGNGDVKDMEDARAKARESGCDGVMLGRAIYGNPWLYAARAVPPLPQERIEALAEHIRLFDALLGGVSNYATITGQRPDITASLGGDEHKRSPHPSFAVMKKHFKAYISGWDHAKELRAQLMETKSAQEALAVLESMP